MPTGIPIRNDENRNGILRNLRAGYFARIAAGRRGFTEKALYAWMAEDPEFRAECYKAAHKEIPASVRTMRDLRDNGTTEAYRFKAAAWLVERSDTVLNEPEIRKENSKTKRIKGKYFGDKKDDIRDTDGKDEG